MSHLFSTVVRCWGTRPTLRLGGYLWVAAMFGLLAALEANRIGVFLVPPFGATLTILMLLPDTPVRSRPDCFTGKAADDGDRRATRLHRTCRGNGDGM